MEQKIIFIKVVEIKTKEGKKYFKCNFLTDDYVYHEQFIDSDLMEKVVNKRLEPLKVYKATFRADKEMKLHLNDIN